jgi:hypothetical protein
MDVTHDEGDGFLNPAVSVRTEFGPKAVYPELSPAGGKIRGCKLLNFVRGHTLIIAVANCNGMASPGRTETRRSI